MTRLRSTRGWPEVARALGLAGACDAGSVIERCRQLGPAVEVVVSPVPSRVRPRARGRYVAGQVMLFPAAFADPRTLAHTLLHELAHADGAGEEEAEGRVSALLSGEVIP